MHSPRQIPREDDDPKKKGAESPADRVRQVFLISISMYPKRHNTVKAKTYNDPCPTFEHFKNMPYS